MSKIFSVGDEVELHFQDQTWLPARVASTTDDGDYVVEVQQPLAKGYTTASADELRPSRSPSQPFVCVTCHRAVEMSPVWGREGGRYCSADCRYQGDQESKRYRDLHYNDPELP